MPANLQGESVRSKEKVLSDSSKRQSRSIPRVLTGQTLLAVSPGDKPVGISKSKLISFRTGLSPPEYTRSRKINREAAGTGTTAVGTGTTDVDTGTTAVGTETTAVGNGGGVGGGGTEGTGIAGVGVVDVCAG